MSRAAQSLTPRREDGELVRMDRSAHAASRDVASATVCAALLACFALWGCGSSPDSDAGESFDRFAKTAIDVGGVETDDPARAVGVEFADLLAATDHAGRVERDRILSFTRAGAEQALADIERGADEVDVGRRAAALVAVASAGFGEQAPRLTLLARAGERIVRRAATLALGELGDDAAVPLLAELAEDPDVAEFALLALARIGTPRASARLDDAAAGERAAAVETARAFVRDPLEAEGWLPGALLLELRFAAARLYGLLGGQAFASWGLDELVHTRRFLDPVILHNAAELAWPGIKDHLVQLLLRDRSPAVIEVAVAAMPTELARLVKARLWEPGTGEWKLLLDAIRERRLYAETLELLRLGVEVEPFSAYAAGLVVAASSTPEAFAVLEAEMDAPEPARRAWVAEAIGESENREWRPELAHLRGDESSAVRAAALVAQARLGEGEAREALLRLLEGRSTIDPSVEADPADVDALVQALVRVAADPRVLPWLEVALDETEGELRLLVAARVTQAGRAEPRALLREALLEGRGGPFRPAMARALGTRPDARDLEVLRALFPDEGDLLVNVEIATALVRARDPAARPVVRAAIWSEPWNRSVLASALAVATRGMTSLLEELASPPPHATDRDLRRVGFAIGEWGGLDLVEQLALRRDPADPALQGAYLGALTTRTQ